MRFQFIPPKLEDLKPLTGLDGPFYFNSRVVYYDPLIDRYWDPNFDHYLTDDELYELICFRDGKLSVGLL